MPGKRLKMSWVLVLKSIARERKDCMDRLGVIGIGNIGKILLKRLVEAGYGVSVYRSRQDPDAIDEVIRMGALPASSAKEVGEMSDVVFICLPAAQQVEEVVLGKNGVLEGIRKDGVIINLSTIGPKAAIKISSEVEKKNVRYIDGAVSRGPFEDRVAALIVIVSGNSETLKDVHQTLKVISDDNVIYAGPVGMAQVLKLANNLMSAVNLFGVIEAFTWAMRQGVKPEVLFKLASTSPGDSWVLRNLLPRMLKRDFKVRFALMGKDVHLFLDLAKDYQLFTPFAALAHQFFQAAKGKGLEDIASTVRIYEQITGIKLEKLDFSNMDI
jgi:3-hydroxyisobutyrate dehydrogenase-like beta-hydroxyacid dehydrogenase